MAVSVGDVAPDFTLKDQNRQDVTLSSFRGDKNVLLIFYPFAFSRVCGGELALVRASLPALQNESVQVLTVSVDSFYAHKVWAEQEGFDFPLLSDFWPHGQVASAYGVFDESRGCALRGSFVLDRDGVVRWTVVRAIPDARDHDEYLSVLATL